MIGPIPLKIGMICLATPIVRDKPDNILIKDKLLNIKITIKLYVN